MRTKPDLKDFKTVFDTEGGEYAEMKDHEILYYPIAETRYGNYVLVAGPDELNIQSSEDYMRFSDVLDNRMLYHILFKSLWLLPSNNLRRLMDHLTYSEEETIETAEVLGVNVVKITLPFELILPLSIPVF